MVLQGILLLWFVLTAGAVAFVVWDSVTNTPTSWVQRLAWILVTSTRARSGLRLPAGVSQLGTRVHDVFTRTLWKQGVNSEMHCLAGDATGIVIAAAIVPAFGGPGVPERRARRNGSVRPWTPLAGRRPFDPGRRLFIGTA